MLRYIACPDDLLLLIWSYVLVQASTQNVGEAVCSRNTFQTLEERPQVREIVRHVREHRPFEKEFVNEVSFHYLALSDGPVCPC